jgi:hypothetical protein
VGFSHDGRRHHLRVGTFYLPFVFALAYVYVDKTKDKMRPKGLGLVLGLGLVRVGIDESCSSILTGYSQHYDHFQPRTGLSTRFCFPLVLTSSTTFHAAELGCHIPRTSLEVSRDRFSITCHLWNSASAVANWVFGLIYAVTTPRHSVHNSSQLTLDRKGAALHSVSDVTHGVRSYSISSYLVHVAVLGFCLLQGVTAIFLLFIDSADKCAAQHDDRLFDVGITIRIFGYIW